MTEQLRIRPDAVEWREVEGEIVALDLRRSLYLAINPSGAVLWPSLVEGASREELVDRLCTRWGIGPDAAGRDVDAFLSELGDQDLLQG